MPTPLIKNWVLNSFAALATSLTSEFNRIYQLLTTDEGNVATLTKKVDALTGATGTFTTADSKTVTVKNGLITEIS